LGRGPTEAPVFPLPRPVGEPVLGRRLGIARTVIIVVVVIVVVLLVLQLL
jgi:hypothetical protein